MTVLAVAEHRRGELRAVSRELLSAGRALTDGTDRPLHAAVVGGPVDQFADRLGCEGVDTVYTMADGRPFDHDLYTQALARLAESVGADLVLAAHTSVGLDYAPALASRLDRPLVTDAVDLATADGLAVTRERDGVETTYAVDGAAAVVTVRPGQWPAAEATGDATVESVPVDVDDPASRATVTSVEEHGEVDLAAADVVVGVGRGIGSEANLDLVFDLADAIGATVAGSGPPVKRGWLSPDRQVGQSGAVVAPDVYIAVGISGAVQHVAGMADSGTIIAVNSDPTAPIFGVADYGVVGDLTEVVPALTGAFRE